MINNFSAIIGILLVFLYYKYTNDMYGSTMLLFFIWLTEYVPYVYEQRKYKKLSMSYYYIRLLNYKYFGSLLFLYYFFVLATNNMFNHWYLFLLIFGIIVSWLFKYIESNRKIFFANLIILFIYTFSTVYTLENNIINLLVAYLKNIFLVFFYLVTVLLTRYVYLLQQDIVKIRKIIKKDN